MAKFMSLARTNDRTYPPGTEGFWRSRRAAPVDSDRVLMSETHHWFRRLPRIYQPKQLCRYYPRIANALAQCWDDQATADFFLSELLVDRRGGRAGFPPRVAEELRLLCQLRERRASRVRIDKPIYRLFRLI